MWRSVAWRIGRQLAQTKALDTQQALEDLDRRVISFDDNRLVAALLGEYDANLAVLEERLGVDAVVQGNVVTLTGDAQACDMAMDVLQYLYGRLEKGEQVGPGEIDGAIRHAQAAPAAAIARANGGSGEPAGDVAQFRTRKRVITSRTPAQSAYIRALEEQELIFATGPAGTGKTYLAVAYAAACLERGVADRLILSRPAVEAGERLGFLPGDMREKVDPYLRPLYDALYDVLAAERVERGLENGIIEIAPLAFMRGRTLTNAIVILDEAQNCTPIQIKMFLTRLGENSQMVVTGDPTQVDLPAGQTSGLIEAIDLLEAIKGITHIGFTRSDVVRRELVSKIVEAYEDAG